MLFDASPATQTVYARPPDTTDNTQIVSRRSHKKAWSAVLKDAARSNTFSTQIPRSPSTSHISHYVPLSKANLSLFCGFVNILFLNSMVLAIRPQIGHFFLSQPRIGPDVTFICSQPQGKMFIHLTGSYSMSVRGSAVNLQLSARLYLLVAHQAGTNFT